MVQATVVGRKNPLISIVDSTMCHLSCSLSPHVALSAVSEKPLFLSVGEGSCWKGRCSKKKVSGKR